MTRRPVKEPTPTTRATPAGFLIVMTILGLIAASQVFMGARAISRGEVTFGGPGKLGSARGGTPHRLVTGKLAVLSGVGHLIVAAGLTALAGAIYLHHVHGRPTMRNAVVKPIMATVFAGGVMVFLPVLF